MKAVQFIAAVVLCIALGIGIAYAVNRVGELNRKAIVVETCLKSGTESQQSKLCADRPYSEAEAKSLRDQADTIGMLGWIAFIFMVFGVGSTVYDSLSGDSGITVDYKTSSGKDDG